MPDVWDFHRFHRCYLIRKVNLFFMSFLRY